MKNIDGAAAALIKNEGAADDQAIADNISQFFSRWEGEPQGVYCLSDAQLIELSEQRDTTSWPEHVNACSRCRKVISLLHQADDKTRFLSRDR
jgi:hypothetical protein